MSELDANIIVDGQKVIAVQAQEGTVVKDGGAIDATSVIETASGKQKVVKVMQVGGGGGSAVWGGITGTLSDQTDLQDALNSKVGIVEGELVVWNKATGTDSLSILGNKATQMQAINIGIGSSASGLNGSIAIGRNATASGERGLAIGSGSNYVSASALGFNSISIGSNSKAQANYTIQLGSGTNNTEKTLQVYDYTLLDGNTGKIPSDRMTKVIELTTTSVELASDNIYNGGELASVSFTLPATVPVNFCAQLNFTSGTTATVLTAPNTITFVGDDCSNGVFTPVASKRYQVLIDSDGVNVNGYVIGR